MWRGVQSQNLSESRSCNIFLNCFDTLTNCVIACVQSSIDPRLYWASNQAFDMVHLPLWECNFQPAELKPESLLCPSKAIWWSHNSHTSAIHIFLQWSTDCVLTVYSGFSHTSYPATLISLLYLASAMIELSCARLTVEWMPNAFHRGTWHGASSLLQKVLSCSRLLVSAEHRWVSFSLASQGFSNWAPPPSTSKKRQTHLPTPTVIQVWSGLERVSCRWKVSRTPCRRGGSHGSDGVGDSERQQGGKKEAAGREAWWVYESYYWLATMLCWLW